MKNREENLEEIFKILRGFAKMDLRLGQIFEIIRSDNKQDLFTIGNDEFLKLLKERLNAG